MPEIALLLPLSAPFPELEETWTTLASLLNGLSRTDVAFHVARISTIVSRNARYDDFEAQLRALAIIEPNTERRANLRAFELANKGKRIVICARGPLLELLRWAITYARDEYNDGHTFQDAEHRDRLLAAICLANSVWSSHAAKTLRARSDDPAGDAALRVSLGRRQSLDNARAPEMHQLFARSSELLEKLLPEEMPTFPALFAQEVGLTLRDFIVITRFFYFYFIEFAESQPDGLKDNIGVFDIDKVGLETREPEKIRKYVRTFSVTLEELADASWGAGCRPRDEQSFASAFLNPPPLHLSLLRDKPILRADDGRCIIGDPYFFGEFVLTGPLFRVPGSEIDTALRAYGAAFEAYVRGTLTRIVPTKRLGTNVVVRDAEGVLRAKIDMAVAGPRSAVLFEVKHSFLRDELVSPGLERELVAHILGRFGDDKKGTGQLAKAIRALATRSDNLWPDLLKGARVFFPVLIISDEKFGEFEGQELALNFGEKMGLPRDVRWNPYPRVVGSRHDLHVAPLSLLTIDDVETLERLGNAALTEVIREYALAGASTRLPFRSFLTGHRRFSSVRPWNPHLREVAMRVTDEFKQLFPSAEGDPDLLSGGFPEDAPRPR